MATQNVVNIGSGYALLPDNMQKLPKPILSFHQWSLVVFTWGQFQRKCSRSRSLEYAASYTFKITAISTISQLVNNSISSGFVDILYVRKYVWIYLCIYSYNRLHCIMAATLLYIITCYSFNLKCTTTYIFHIHVTPVAENFSNHPSTVLENVLAQGKMQWSTMISKVNEHRMLY